VNSLTYVKIDDFVKDGDKNPECGIGDVVIAGYVQAEEVGRPPELPPMVLDLDDPLLVGEL
jgi:hypothetical protein